MGHGTCIVAVEKVVQKKPATHGFALDVALASARQAPVLGHAAHAAALVPL
jgi:hypothetical protein